MKKFKLITVLILVVLCLGSTCKNSNDCCDEYNQMKRHAEKLLKDYNLLQYDYKKTVIVKDSLEYNYIILSKSWEQLVNMYDSLLKQPPDTFWFIPQCRLFYERLDTIDGIPLYLGYDGIHYRLMQDSATLYNYKINWIDTTVTRYRLSDSTIILDSIVTRKMGEVVLWSHVLCEKYATDTCKTKVVLGHVLTGSRTETENITFLIIDAISISVDKITYPDLNLKVNNELVTTIQHSKKNGNYTQLIYLDFDDINKIELTPVLDTDHELLVKDVILNDLKLNHPEGWNVTLDDNIQYMGNTYFLMLENSTIKFEKR